VSVPETGHTLALATRPKTSLNEPLDRACLTLSSELTMMSSSNGCLPTARDVPQGHERERHPVLGKTPMVGSRWFWVAARRTVISASGIRRCDISVTMLRKAKKARAT
jgi:hypothetical protein